MSRESEKNLSSLVSSKKLPAVVYGLKGIMSVFGVSKSTAFRYRHGVIEDACQQHGNVIVVDVKKALELFSGNSVQEIVEIGENAPEVGGL